MRPLTQRPYVNGPDGFGSGQPGGMLAGMADGSVRFISKDVDPGVIEQLATIHGNDGATAAAWSGSRSGPQPVLQGPDELRTRRKSLPRRTRPGQKPAAAEAAADDKIEARLADKLPNIELVRRRWGEAIDTAFGDEHPADRD